MSRLPDLVLDSKLDTQFRKDYVRHVFHEADPASAQRAKSRKEYWKRERCIGRGAFASVWLENRVRGEGEAKVRAVKQLAKPANAKEYLRELESIAKFSHPRYARCFVRSFGWFEDESELYITMEYLSHGDLHNYLKTEAALPELDAQQIAIQICEGLSMMHENGFAHRDLKPGNILIHGKPPGQWWIKIADFGISKRTEHTIAGPSTRKGTETFMPPEWHGFGSGEDDGLPNMPQAIDMWSLGETISRMITKEATFKTPYDLFRFAEAQDMFPEQSLRAHNASADAIDLITALMKLSPEARLTASQALQHRWLHTDSPSHSREPSIASLDELSSAADSSTSEDDSGQLETTELEDDEALVNTELTSNDPMNPLSHDSHDDPPESHFTETNEWSDQDEMKLPPVVDLGLADQTKVRDTAARKDPSNKHAFYDSGSDSLDSSVAAHEVAKRTAERREREKFGLERDRIVDLPPEKGGLEGIEKAEARTTTAASRLRAEERRASAGSGGSNDLPPQFDQYGRQRADGRRADSPDSGGSEATTELPPRFNPYRRREAEVDDAIKESKRPSTSTHGNSVRHSENPHYQKMRIEEYMRRNPPQYSSVGENHQREPAPLKPSKSSPSNIRSQRRAIPQQSYTEGLNSSTLPTREASPTPTFRRTETLPENDLKPTPPQPLGHRTVLRELGRNRARSPSPLLRPPMGDSRAHGSNDPLDESLQGLSTFTTGRGQYRNADFTVSPKGDLLAVWWFNYLETPIIEIWDISAGRRLHRLQSKEWERLPYEGYSYPLQFSPDSQYLTLHYPTTGDKVRRLMETYDMKTGKKLRGILGSNKHCFDIMAFTPDGTSLAHYENDQILLRDLATGALILWFDCRHVTSLYVDNTTVAVTAGKNRIEFFDSATAEPILRTRLPERHTYLSRWIPSAISYPQLLFIKKEHTHEPNEKLEILSIWKDAAKNIQDVRLWYDDASGSPWNDSRTMVAVSADRSLLARRLTKTQITVFGTWTGTHIATVAIDESVAFMGFLQNSLLATAWVSEDRKSVYFQSFDLHIGRVPYAKTYGPEDIRWSRGRDSTAQVHERDHIKPSRPDSVERVPYTEKYRPEDIRWSRRRSSTVKDREYDYVKPSRGDSGERVTYTEKYGPEDVRWSRGRGSTAKDHERDYAKPSRQASVERVTYTEQYGPEDIRWSRGRKPAPKESDPRHVKPSMQRSTTYAY